MRIDTDNPDDPNPPDPATPPGHCGRLDDHAPHDLCIGGPLGSPGNVGKQAVDDVAAIELLAWQWRQNQQSLTAPVTLLAADRGTLVEDSYTFAREALQKLKAAGVEMVVRAEP